MTQEVRDLSFIDGLIAARRSFAIFSMPESEEVTLVTQRADTQPLTADTIEWINGRSGFVVAPFAVTPLHPIVLISPDSVERFRLPWSDRSGNLNDVYAATPTDSYRHCFGEFTSALRAGEFHKLVLSRKADISTPNTIDVAGVFTDACRRYHHSYIYMFHTPQTGVWIGCTPEVLLSGSGTCYTTMSLAGTQEAPRDGGVQVEWNEKNRREQAYVSDYIRSSLSSYGAEPQEDAPRTVKAGELVHLRTDFRFSLNDSERLGSLLSTLHPTPAVCGLPKEEAYNFILRHEGYDRGYYSGFVGMLSPEAETALFVNLRCMKVEGKSATLYAGGGLLSSSELEDEWMETERKMATMKRVIRIE
jgi:isochorismate synthase